MAEPTLIYKITILQMLSRVDFPLSNTQICNFFLEKQYTDYFTAQQSISDLLDNKMIEAKASHGNTQYSITGAGLETLELFSDKITKAIKEDILEYFQENSFKMKKKNSVTADYYHASHGGFDVNCRVMEGRKRVIDFTVTVSSEEQAKAMCTNWKSKYEDIYITCLETLME